jgi:uncharacterized delta-60 repeat protein
MKWKCCLLFFLALTNLVKAQFGSLDNTFGTNGIVVNDEPQGSANAVSIQKDGKIVVAGNLNSGVGVIRYNTDGTFDHMFGSNGTIINSTGSFTSGANAIAIQPDNKIVIAGYSQNNGDYDDFLIIRYNPDGSPDKTFGTNGGILIKSISPFDDYANAIAVQKDGKIVVAGNAFINHNACIAVVRFNPDGSLDDLFGNGGIVITTELNYCFAYALTILPDNKIVIAGSEDFGFLVVRYNSNGEQDNTFGINGIVLTHIDQYDKATAISIQPNGKIIVAGNSGYAPNISIARYNDDGTLDTSFGKNGITTTSIKKSNIANAIIVQKDGKIVVAGTFGNQPDVNNSSIVLRYNPDGTQDSYFGDNGLFTTYIKDRSYGYALAIQSDEKIVVAGCSVISNPNYSWLDSNHFFVARYENNYTGINESKKWDTYSIYPNPTKSQLTIENTRKMTLLLLYDINGHILRSLPINDTSVNLDIGNLRNGVYLVKIIDEQSYSMIKILKEE